MGAYLSEPITKKEIETEENENFWVSSASMQGWRVSQEDAHNAILDYDDFTSLFAVYDGHGGHEVAVYTAKRLPNFIKSRGDYRLGNIEKGLVEAFVEFDRTLIERDVVRELRVIAGKEADGGQEVDHEEVDHLFQEATMPIEAVMAKNGTKNETAEAEQAPMDSKASAPEAPEAGPIESDKSALTRFKTRNGGNKPISPFLRAKPTSGSAATAETDVAAKLSFNKDDPEEAKDTSDQVNEVINGSIESNGHSNGHDKNGGEEQAKDVKGKGKGKGKGKSSQIVKKNNDNDDDSSAKDDPEEESLTKIEPRRKPKTAQELYQNLVNDEVMDEESEDDSNAFENDDDDDDDDEDDEEAEEEESDEEEDDTADEDEEAVAEEYIGGDFNEEPGNDSGCTAVVALLVGRDLYVANAGDSRCIVCRDGKAVEMSFDHKPEDEPERERINKAGGRVTPDGRVNGGLNLSRAIGDHAYKTNKELPLIEQMISPVPDVKKLTIDPATDTFIFLACDGIWNSLNSQEVVDFINERIDNDDKTTQESDTKERLTRILEELFDHCLAPDTMGDGTGCDNMTAVIAKLKPTAFNKVENKEAAGVVKRPLDEDQPEEPQSKKAKTESESTKDEEVKKEPTTAKEEQEKAGKEESKPAASAES